MINKNKIKKNPVKAMRDEINKRPDQKKKFERAQKMFNAAINKAKKGKKP